MGRLTTHILDTSTGKPGAHILIEVFRVSPGDGSSASQPLTKSAEATTNADGRCDMPLLEGDAFQPGIYQLHFHVGAYFDELEGQASLPSPKFLDIVILQIGIAQKDEHYHVPLLLSPYSYSTYRGS